MRSVLSALLFVHGLVHAVGFIGPLELISRAPFQTVVFHRPLANDSLAARSLAVLWLLLALAFSVASVALITRASWWFPFTAVLTFASMLLCTAAWPATKAGLAVNVVLLCACLVLERAELWTDLLALFRVLSF
jgi:hypothetical protein